VTILLGLKSPSLAAFLGSAVLLAACARAPRASGFATVTPQAAVDELLTADRLFAAASARTNLVSGLSAMFAPDVMMPMPGGRFATGRDEAVAALRANADNAGARIEWTPVRGGVSADAHHGFTFGYMTLTKPDSTRTLLKYLAYWVKGPDGWRVAAYKRGRRPAGEVSLAPMAPSLPPATVPPNTNAAEVERARESLAAAEQAFSDRAQIVGLGAAFTEFGRADAMNMGGQNNPQFVIGAPAIGQLVGEGTPTTSSPVSWNSDRTLVASSGDLGVTFGIIRPNAPSASGPAGFAFFTIWRRDRVTDPWRYIAE
jgi:hypothetical protein